MRTFTAVEAFTGPGGLSLGLHSAGFETIVAIEKVESCVATYRRNFPNVHVIHSDIRDVSFDKVKELVLASTGKPVIDLVAGGPPCETFSTAGPGARSTRDHRDYLFQYLIKMAKALSANYILIENVPGLETKKSTNGEKSGIFKQIIAMLREAGFENIKWSTLNSASFGVPQFRERLFILASNTPNYIDFPQPTHGPNCSFSWVTVDEAFGDLPFLDNAEEQFSYLSPAQNDYQKLMRGEQLERFGYLYTSPNWTTLPESGFLTLHRAPNHRPGTIERFKLISPGEGLKDIMTKFDSATISDLQKQRILPQKWYIQRNRRMWGSKPSPTVTSHCLSELLHPTQHRHITPREAARLQSFPDWYFFEGSWVVPHNAEEQDKYEQIGDAVPPIMAAAIGRELVKAIKGELSAKNNADVSYLQGILFKN